MIDCTIGRRRLPIRSEGHDHVGGQADDALEVAGADKLLADRGLELKVTPAAKAFIAERGYDRVYGARPLKRSIQKNLIDPLANALISGEFQPGDAIVADLATADERIVFAREPRAEGEAA